MLTYFYIALGGAIGSVARAWTTNAMVRALGPHFPWGTILINIIGSFIIGLFGALTANDGRFTAHPDARAFVMIGICGGYTTFSSFSLQTLDLIRDGKLGAALANIALSVLLCLLAVTAGYATAMMVNRGAEVQTAVHPAKTMGRVVLAVAGNLESTPSLLAGAAGLLKLGNGGLIKALAVRMPPVSELMLADQAVTPLQEATHRANENMWAAGVKDAVEAWEAREKPSSITVDWIDVEGDVARIVAQQSRRSEIVVASNEKSEKSSAALHAAIFETSRATLVQPASAGEFGRVVAVAWKQDLRAPKAVLAAIPILARAKAVHVLQATPGAAPFPIPDILAEHGIPAQTHAVPLEERPVGARLLKLAHELGADLIVMGAYAHGEWREMLFGGVTRYMLDHADLPLLMRH